MKQAKGLSRRDFLKGVGLTGLGMALAAAGCQPKTVIVREEVEKEVTKVVEVEKEKIVKETVVVEVTAVPEPVEAPEGPVAVSFWHSWAPDGPQGIVLQSMVDEFNESAEVALVTLSYVGTQRTQKIAASLAAGTPPELIWEKTSYAAGLYDAGQAITLDEYLAASTVIKPEDFFGRLLEMDQYMGLMVSMPFENSSIATYYNTRQFDEAGADPPPADGDWTWDDFVEIAKAFSDPDNDKWGWDPHVHYSTFRQLFWSGGGEFYSDDLRTSTVDQGDAAARGLQILYDTVFTHKITTMDPPDAGFANELMPLYMSGPWDAPRLLAANPDLEFGIVPMPKHPDTGRNDNYWYEKCLAILKTSPPVQDATWTFLEWFMSAEVHARWAVDASYLPITRTAAADSTWQTYVADHPEWQAFIKQAETMRQNPPGLPGCSDSQMIEYVMFEEKSIEDAIAWAKEDHQTRLDDWWSKR